MTNKNQEPVEQLAKSDEKGAPIRVAEKDDKPETDRSDPVPQYDSFMRIIRR